jgi:phosphoribosylaminoimidazole (AIR) synthetase
MNPLTYRADGVDIDADEDAVRRIASLARAMFSLGEIVRGERGVGLGP